MQIFLINIIHHEKLPVSVALGSKGLMTSAGGIIPIGASESMCSDDVAAVFSDMRGADAGARVLGSGTTTDG